MPLRVGRGSLRLGPLPGESRPGVASFDLRAQGRRRQLRPRPYHSRQSGGPRLREPPEDPAGRRHTLVGHRLNGGMGATAKGISGSDPPTAPSGTRRPWRRWALSLVVIALAYLLGQRVAEQEGQADMDTMWSDLRLGDCIHDVWADHCVVVPAPTRTRARSSWPTNGSMPAILRPRPRTRSLIGKQPQQKRPCTPTPASRQAAGRMTTWSKDQRRGVGAWRPTPGRLRNHAGFQ